MKRHFWVALGVLWSTALTALPLGNPLDGSLLYEGVWTGGENEDPYCAWACFPVKFRIGYYGDYVYNQRMRVKDGRRDDAIHRTSLYTNSGYLALNFWDRVDVFGTLGATKIAIATPGTSWSIDGSLNQYSYVLGETSFAWSVGGRATLWECGCWGIGLEGQYASSHPSITSSRLEGEVVDYIDAHFSYHEWQIGLGTACRIPVISAKSALVPYAGIKWSHSHISTDNARSADGLLEYYDLSSGSYFGYAVGLTLVGSARWSLTAEARFVNERAFSLNTQFVF